MSIANPRLTEEEFMRLPDDGRKYELVDGEAKEVPAGYEQAIIGSAIIAKMYPYTRGRGYMSTGQAGFRMTNSNIRCPDVSFMLKSRLLDGRPSEGFEQDAPDLCIEIISPSKDRRDMERKVREYFAAGAQQVWHLFPDSRTLKVYTSPTDVRDYGEADEIDGGDLLPGFRCQIAELLELE